MNHRLFLQNLWSMKKPVTELDWQNRNLKEGVVSGAANTGLNATAAISGYKSFENLTGKNKYTTYNPENLTDRPGTEKFNSLTPEGKVASYQSSRNAPYDFTADIGNVAAGAGAAADLTGNIRGLRRLQTVGHPLLMGGIAASSGTEAVRLAREGKYREAIDPAMTGIASVSQLLNVKRLGPLSYAVFGRDLSGIGGEGVRELSKMMTSSKPVDWLKAGMAGAEVGGGLVGGYGMKRAAQAAIARKATKTAAGPLALIPSAVFAAKDVGSAVNSVKRGDYLGAATDIGLGAGELLSGAVTTIPAMLVKAPKAQKAGAAVSTGIDALIAPIRTGREELKFEDEMNKGWRDEYGNMTKDHPEFNSEYQKALKAAEEERKRQAVQYPQPA